MKNSVLIALLSFIFIFSCSEPEFGDEPNLDVNNISLKSSSNDYYELKKKFAIALHKAMKDHQEVRQFIKDEALKKFNGDYDVLYNYVSDARVAGSSFRDIIASYYENESDLTELENAVPSLTIFVPKLPEDSFSAENWNVAEEVPLVAIRQLGSNKVPLISSDETSYLLPGGIIPSFPVVVLKRNERITLPNQPSYNNLDTREITGTNGFRFKFFAPIFNNIFPPMEIVIDGTPDYLIDAWQVNGENQNLGWHRDYIYYQLQPTSAEGPYINDYTEFITDFKIEAPNGMEALKKIADTPLVSNDNNNDPSLDPIGITHPSIFSQATFWTDGAFEFGVNVMIDGIASFDPESGMNNGQNEYLSIGIDALPTDLFDIEYDSFQFVGLTFYVATGIDTKLFRERHMIFRWSIHDDSNRWKFLFQEIDTDVDAQKTESFTTKRNVNFEYTLTDVKKLGIKLGGEQEITSTSSFGINWKDTSDDLEQQFVEFGDNVIIDENSVEIPGWFPLNLKWYELRRYDTGDVSFSLMPIKVQ